MEDLVYHKIYELSFGLNKFDFEVNPNFGHHNSMYFLFLNLNFFIPKENSRIWHLQLICLITNRSIYLSTFFSMIKTTIFCFNQ